MKLTGSAPGRVGAAGIRIAECADADLLAIIQIVASARCPRDSALLAPPSENVWLPYIYIIASLA